MRYLICAAAGFAFGTALAWLSYHAGDMSAIGSVHLFGK